MRAHDRRRVLTSEERVLWSTVTRSIAPLRNSEPLADEEPEAGGSAAPPAARPIRPLAAPAREAEPPMLAPLGRRARTRITRGREAIDARLDLHGLTQSEAHARLLHFLRSAASRGARLVLVITGKGARGEEERGVLKRQVPQWLRLPEFRSLVIGYEDAHAADGGEGALYVRLRRSKVR
jgi:DNA-nicking Smr family endonuclease